MTHPFHPLFGQEFAVAEYRQHWGEDRVHFYGAKGCLQAIPVNCTDAGRVDPFVEISAGRCAFRYEDLCRLIEIVGLLLGGNVK